MNKFNPKKLLNSKWTAVEPVRKEKHFIVTGVKFDDAGDVIACTIEAVISRRSMSTQWQDLQDTKVWLQGWK